MGRPIGKHIDSRELNGLVPSYSGDGRREYSPLPASIRDAEHHLASCPECRRKVSQYLQLMDRSSNVNACEAGSPQRGCPTDIDWHEVAAGLGPEARTRQLITHAARCAHCGPFLRAASSADDPTPQEEEFLAQLKAPSRPALLATNEPATAIRDLSIWRQFLDWKILVPAGALLILVAILNASRPSSSAPLSGTDLARFAASTHQRHLQGSLALAIQTDSQPLLSQWLHENSQFSLALPASSEDPRQELAYRLEGARLIQIDDKTAAYIAYRMPADPVSLIVTPVSVAVASGGIEVAFQKVTFHYHMVQGYKVVTWSVHGLTYALVSQEGNKTQRSCMVCHSAMRDRDLSHTPTPLPDRKNPAEAVWQ